MSNKPWCVIPFISFSNSSDGKYKLCCQSYDVKNMNINNTIVEDFFSSEYMKNIRHNMLYNKDDPEIKRLCAICVDQDKLNIESIYNIDELIDELITKRDGYILIQDNTIIKNI
jgi:hypothetical protein